MLLPSAIVVSPFVGLLEQNDDHERHGGRMLLRLAAGATPLLATQPGRRFDSGWLHTSNADEQHGLAALEAMSTFRGDLGRLLLVSLSLLGLERG